MSGFDIYKGIYFISPCCLLILRKENPVIVKAWNQFKDKNFTILGVSLDRKKEPWLQAIEKDGLTWTHVCDFKDWNSDVAKMYAVKWILAAE